MYLVYQIIIYRKGYKMKNNGIGLFSVLFIVFLILISLLFIGLNKNFGISEYVENKRTPEIFPDYNSAVIPPNIAPLNFSIAEKGKKYYVSIYSDNSRGIKISSRSQKIVIPKRKWKNLLDNNHGKSVFIDIYIKNQDMNTKNYFKPLLFVAFLCFALLSYGQMIEQPAMAYKGQYDIKMISL